MRRRSDTADSAPCLPINDDSWPSEISDMRNGFAGTLTSYRTVAHHPALLRAWAPLRQHVIAIELAARPLSPPVEDGSTSPQRLGEDCCSDKQSVASHLRG